MLPLHLKIQGLYSYRTLQNIDFQELTHQHLFGIFGPVGSGKSSILDAITFALYGQIERIGSKDELHLNVFNPASPEFLIDFEFESGPDKSRFRFVVKNSRKKNGEPRSFERFAYRWENQTWRPLDLKDATSVFGLSYDNFRRTVIIPQGRFSDFLQLTGGERTKMMLEIFPKLSEFDISGKVGQFLSDSNLQLSGLEGQLLEIGPLDSLNPIEKEARLAELKEVVTEARKQLNVKEKTFADWEELRKIQIDREKTRMELQELEEKTPSFSARKKELEDYEFLVRNFESDMTLLDLARSEFSVAKQKKEETELALSSATQTQIRALEELESIRSQVQQIPEWEEEIRALRRFTEGTKLEAEAEALRKIRDQKTEDLVALRAKRSGLQDTILALREKSEALLDFTNERTGLMELAQLLKEKDRLQQDSASKEKTESEILAGLEAAKRRKEEVLTHPLVARIPKPEGELKIKDLIALLLTEKESIRSGLNGLRTELVEAGTRLKLVEFASDLKPGDPCPLCGSVHHPSVLTDQDVSLRQSEIQKQISFLEDQMEELEGLLRILEDVKTEANLLVGQRNALLPELEHCKRLQSENQALINAHPLVGNTAQSINQRLSELDSFQKEGSRLRDELKKVEAEKETLDRQSEIQDGELQTVTHTLSGLEGNIQALRNQSSLDPDRFAGLENPEVRISELERQKEGVEQALAQKDTAFQAAQNRLTQCATEAEMYQKLVVEKEKTRSDRTAAFLKKMKELNQESEESVRRELAKKLNVEQLRKETETFFTRLAELKTRRDALEEKALGRVFDELQWNEARRNLEESKQQLSEREAEAAVVQKELETLRIQREKALDLVEKKEKLQIRIDNLKTLNALFYGNKFVNFASSVYLKNVVEVANQRFFRLTRQKLRLVLDEQNTFYVKDFMNGGHERLAKTLSGGQIFQASLSLALALSDIVNHRNQSEKNFFFLDEGFGTLDKDSLALVFDTLRQLRTENRIVGVISHVEEMQQEIDACLRIRMDEERGSVIEKVS